MIGENLNGFTIKSLISEEGGMAKVYLAENSIGKKAAVKVLRPKFFWDEPVKQRFINEAKTMVKLEHEHICSVYDLVVTDNYAAILLEFMEGDDLSVLLDKQKTFSEEEVLEYLPQIFSALGMAHQKGVVHRDIKPSNLFLHNGKIKLMDFGIAMVKTEAGGRMTQTGTRMGSISYMSPEQIRSTKDVDLRTDIYSLGITIHQLLTGSLPYTLGKTDTDFAIMEKIVHEDPKPIAGISNQMNELIQKATAKETKDRFATMEGMLQYIDSQFNQIQINENSYGKKKSDLLYTGNSIIRNKETDNEETDNEETVIENSAINNDIEEYFALILDVNEVWVYCENGHRSMFRDGNKLKCKECSWEYKVDDKIAKAENIFPGNYVHWIDNKEGIFTNIETKLSYSVVKIGKLVWFSENFYSSEKNKDILKGQKYTYKEAIIACPIGTKLPSDEDWIELEKKIGMKTKDFYRNTSLFGFRGKKLAPHLIGENNIGFNLIYTHSTLGQAQAWLWTSTKKKEHSAWARFITALDIDRVSCSIDDDLYVRYILK